ncbi:MAG TPA: hypothetical protein VGG20_20390 [Thermoanaerobaculia bacterium]|jgi:hypothetical protein
MTTLVRTATLRGLLLGALLSIPAAVMGQTLPPPARFITFLDMRCYQITNQPPLGLPLRLDHLNPVFVAKGMPAEQVTLGVPQDLCVPVQKNTYAPPPDVLPFIQYVDWKCYAISGPSLDLPLHLDHLNPVIAGMFGPSDDVVVRRPQQLCVPVSKNSQVVPPEVLRLVQFLDVKCYGVDATTKVFGNINLTHLNPLFAKLPTETATIVGPTASQLCVPVAKNGMTPPADVLPLIQYSDVLCYALNGRPLNAQLKLTHLNPVLIGLGAQPEDVFVSNSDKLCVPVAKEGNFPPDGTATTTAAASGGAAKK